MKNEDVSRYKLLFQSSSSAIAIHQMLFTADGSPSDYIFIDVNSEFERITGLEKEKILGKRVTAVIPGIENTHFIESYGNVVKSGQSISFDDYVELLQRHYLIKAYRLDEQHFVADFTDITKHKQTENNLKNRLEDLRKSQKITHIGTWRLNVKNNEVYWTEELYKMYGFDPGQPPPPYSEHRKLFTPESWELLSTSLEQTKKDGIPYELELETVTSDGTNGWMWVRGEALYNPEGEITEIWGAAQDITSRKLNEIMIRKQLQEKELILREVHHRIKNNISSISSLLEIQLESGNKEACKILSDAIARVSSMRVLYENLLISDQFRNISIKEYLDKLIFTIISLFKDIDSITVKTRISDARVSTNQIFTIGLIVNEMLTNSMKYAFPENREGCIEIILNLNNNEAELIIRDDGVGLPEKFSIEESDGFGLTLVKMMVEQLDGSFSMSSDNGTQTVILFRIASVD